MQMQKQDIDILALTAEEIIRDAIRFFEMTLNGLGKTEEFRVEIIEHYALYEQAHVSVRIPGLAIPEHLFDICDNKFNDKMEAAKALAMYAVNFTVYYADKELFTPPDEQSWMHSPMAYWHELKDDAFIYKNKYLVNISSDE